MRGTIVQIVLSLHCSKRSSIGVDRIPTLEEASDVGDLFFVPEDGHVLFYGIAVLADCNLLTVNIRR